MLTAEQAQQRYGEGENEQEGAIMPWHEVSGAFVWWFQRTILMDEVCIEDGHAMAQSEWRFCLVNSKIAAVHRAQQAQQRCGKGENEHESAVMPWHKVSGAFA